jgi:hypothetical protein
LLGAIGGQLPITKDASVTSGFWGAPSMFNARFQVATDYITSASVFIEYITEGRERTDLWSDQPHTNDPPPYNSIIREELSMTVLGIEGSRTLLRFGDLRIAATVGAGYGLGTATAEVTKLSTGQKKQFESCDFWHGLYINASLRPRYTIYHEDRFDIGLTAAVRAWGFPTIGPFGDCVTSYNGPALTARYEIGYLAGVSVGFF